ncbi:MAG: ABC transporter substrate-binding protein [Candidatus Thorarchaeota archaeon]
MYEKSRYTKNIAIILLSIILGASILANIILSIQLGNVPSSTKKVASVAIRYPDIAKNDPVDTNDQSSFWHQSQISQGLVHYDVSKHPDYQPRPLLAEYWIWESPIRISFKIRENVYFHDDTLLDADAIKWNFDRLMHFSNETGDVVANETSKIGYSSNLYYLSNGTYLFDNFESDGAYNFTINLNSPFGVLLDLLCFGSTNIISPSSHKFYEIVQRDEILVGTGPWKFQRHVPRQYIRYVRWERYWATGPYFEELLMRFIDNDEERMNRGLAGEFDYVTGVPYLYLDNFSADSTFHVEEIGEGLVYYFLELYCGPQDYQGNMIEENNFQYQRNNATLRRALALAINYTYLWEEIGPRDRYPGFPIVPRVMPAYNNSLEGKMAQDFPFNGTYEGNVEKARDLMKIIYPSIGLSSTVDGGANDNAWIALAQGSSPLWDIRINEHPGGSLITNLKSLLGYNWALIGIDVDETVRQWDEYLDFEHEPWEFDGEFIGIGYDYLNPYNTINQLFDLKSNSYFSRVNDTKLASIIMNALNTVNYSAHLAKWMDIQSYIFDITLPESPSSYCHIPTYTYKDYQIHKTTLKGLNYNVLKILDTWYWYHDEVN